MNFEKQLSDKDEQIKNLTQMHDTLQLRVETTIEKAVRNKINTIRDMYAEKTQDEKDNEIKTLTEMVLIANQEANEQKSNYAELKEKITGLEKKVGKRQLEMKNIIY